MLSESPRCNDMVADLHFPRFFGTAIQCEIARRFPRSVVKVGPGGALNFFSGRGVRPGFPKFGACELTFASEKGGLWAKKFQIWGLVSWKFPNLGACELKISKFGGLWAKIWVKIEAVEAKISKFSQKGVLWTDSFAWNGILASGRRGVKRGVFRAAHPHTPFLGQCPPGSRSQRSMQKYQYLFNLEPRRI